MVYTRCYGSGFKLTCDIAFYMNNETTGEFHRSMWQLCDVVQTAEIQAATERPRNSLACLLIMMLCNPRSLNHSGLSRSRISRPCSHESSAWTSSAVYNFYNCSYKARYGIEDYHANFLLLIFFRDYVHQIVMEHDLPRGRDPTVNRRPLHTEPFLSQVCSLFTQQLNSLVLF